MKKKTKIVLGKSVTIKGISSASPLKIKRRLLDLGFTKGTKIIVKKKSLLGETFLVEIRRVLFTLRGDILEFVLVE